MLSAYLEVDRSECCGGCQRRDPDNRLIGYRIWCRTERDAVVGDFVRQHQKDIALMFESASKENADVVSLKFIRNGWGKNDVPMQYTVARFHVPLITSYVDEMDVFDMIAQLTEKVNHYRRLNFDLNIFQINYLRLCWGSYRSPMECAFIPTPRWLALKRAIVNVQCFDDVRKSFQYSVLAGMNLFSSANHKL